MTDSVRPFTIDIHTHILPRTWPDLEQRYGYGGFLSLEHHRPGCARMVMNGRTFREVQENCWSPDRRIEECDAAGVDVQVLSTVPVMFNYGAQPADTHDLSRQLNDHLAEVVAAHPTRFAALGTLPMQDPARAIEELERCVSELRLPGVQIGTHVNGKNLDHADIVPVFEAAEALGAAIFVHPWDMLGSDRMGKYWLPWLVGMPAETSLAITSLMFSGVLDRLPNLRICFAHGGGGFFGTLGRLDRGHAVRPDLCAVDGATSPSSYLGRFYVDSLVHDPVLLRRMVQLMGPERVALGSDYPFPLGEAIPGSIVDALGDLGDELCGHLRHGTALHFLGLDPSHFGR